MFVFPINRVPDETNHARMTWETFHKPTETSFKWMDEIPSNDKVKLAEYKQIFAQKIDMSKETFQFGVSLKTISFIPQLIGMTIGSWKVSQVIRAWFVSSGTRLIGNTNINEKIKIVAKMKNKFSTFICLILFKISHHIIFLA